MEQFQEKLEDRIKSHDRDIERMCNFHYQGFIDSVRELQQVGGDAANLKVLCVQYTLCEVCMHVCVCVCVCARMHEHP